MAAGVSLLVLVIALGAIVVVAGRHANRPMTEDRYEEKRKAGTTTGNAFLAAQALWDPGAQRALEQRTVEDAFTIESGGPPDPTTE